MKIFNRWHGVKSEECSLKTKIDVKRTGHNVDWFELVQYSY